MGSADGEFSIHPKQLLQASGNHAPHLPHTFIHTSSGPEVHRGLPPLLGAGIPRGWVQVITPNPQHSFAFDHTCPSTFLYPDIILYPPRFDLASILTRAPSAWHPEDRTSPSSDDDLGEAQAGEAEEGVAWPTEGITGTVEDEAGSASRGPPPPAGPVVNEAGIMTNGEGGGGSLRNGILLLGSKSFGV